MKLFLEKALLFGFILLIALIAAELIVRAIPNDYAYKNAYLQQHAAEIEILSFGSSHGQQGINPAYFTKRAFNGGHSSQSISYDYRIWNKFKSSLTNLDTLILPISYFSFFSDLSESVESWRVKNYALYYDIEPKPFEARLEIYNQTPYAIFLMTLKAVLGKTNLSVDTVGFPLQDTQPKNLVTTGIAAAQRHTHEDAHNLEKNVAYLSSMLEDCRAMGVNVVLVTTPTSHYYYDLLDENQLALMHASLDAIIGAYDNVVYYDLLKDDRFIDADFRDADHLASAGAAKLSKILNDIIEGSEPR